MADRIRASGTVIAIAILGLIFSPVIRNGTISDLPPHFIIEHSTDTIPAPTNDSLSYGVQDSTTIFGPSAMSEPSQPNYELWLTLFAAILLSSVKVTSFIACMVGRLLPPTISILLVFALETYTPYLLTTSIGQWMFGDLWVLHPWLETVLLTSLVLSFSLYRKWQLPECYLKKLGIGLYASTAKVSKLQQEAAAFQRERDEAISELTDIKRAAKRDTGDFAKKTKARDAAHKMDLATQAKAHKEAMAAQDRRHEAHVNELQKSIRELESDKKTLHIHLRDAEDAQSEEFNNNLVLEAKNRSVKRNDSVLRQQLQRADGDISALQDDNDVLREEVKALNKAAVHECKDLASKLQRAFPNRA
ncbi:hypothetical protein LTR85_000592 [Meristemomyces frigidus]|nr:hypothetical protein LTR85_000592 [Meristemomyces frigidus]